MTVETVKSPTSLGRQDNRRSVVYEGPTREACVHFPRNVNVHAAVALAGIGFDRTISRIISDPEVSTNAHRISLSGDGISITLDISSYAAGAVTGAYTPYSACGSLEPGAGERRGPSVCVARSGHSGAAWEIIGQTPPKPPESC